MSDLGAIFHVTADGKQYDAHAYTTLDECPYPNIKIKFKGQQAYVKLGAKGEGDVPCYVKTNAGNTYQVKKEAVPTGSVSIVRGDLKTITIPAAVRVVKVQFHESKYIGVTPGASYDMHYYTSFSPSGLHPRRTKSLMHQKANGDIVTWDSYSTTSEISYSDAIISWSPEIDKNTPDMTDYI